ncbi:hypothetical protein C8Q80DRAFT_1061353, partial [Daedaleopsis nitida]
NDPFDDKPSDRGHIRKSRRKVYEDMTVHVIDILLRRNRTALHTVFINGESFRAVRWDRSGVVATEAINYVRRP